MINDFRKKQKGSAWQKKGILILVGIIAAALLVVMVVADINLYLKKRELNYQVNSLQHKIAEMKKNNADLQQGIAEVDNNSYIEKVAREQLGLQKPGESVVSFVDAPPPVQTATGAPKYFWQAWLGWLFNRSK